MLKLQLIVLSFMAILFVFDAKGDRYVSTSQTPMDLLRQSVIPLNSLDDSEDIILHIGQKPLVLIGDSTHGTHEFYQQRINISKRLIQEKNFKLVVLEGDWPNVYTLNQYIQSQTSLSARQVLHSSNPDAVWLWNNVEMLNFIVWLKKYNENLPAGEQKVSVHGMDIYSFNQSREQLIDYLQLFSSQAAQQAYQRYQCFALFNNNLHRYGKAVRRDQSLSCEKAVIEQYLDFSDCRYPCPEQYKSIDDDGFFYAQQNARVMKNTEKSFRLQYWFDDDTVSWNQRDRHMMESLLASADHLNKPKTIIWAHNSHTGDARATEMADRAQLNIGQLLRQTFGEQMFSIGMLTYSGKVMAADDWNLPAKIKRLLAAHPYSNEALFHQLAIPHFVLYLHQSADLSQYLNQSRLQRHVGVVYRPDDEMDSHYSYTHLADQFDAIIFIDSSSGLGTIFK
ncbi:MAG: erythromycin esterase family protein [gamma proteobacterium symbiont of Taylorina sp.]|nr:erythromycin esterase family protein [gamma proteobacterium symbiont of Taylorina sp.]